MQKLKQNTQGCRELKGLPLWFCTHLQSLQGHKPCDGESINDVLFSRSRLLSLSTRGSRAGWAGLPVTLPLRVRGEAKDGALNVVVPYPIWSPLPIPGWPRLPLLAEATRSGAIHVLHRKHPDKPSSYREWNSSRAKHWHCLTSTRVKPHLGESPRYPSECYQYVRSKVTM